MENRVSDRFPQAADLGHLMAPLAVSVTSRLYLAYPKRAVFTAKEYILPRASREHACGGLYIAYWLVVINRVYGEQVFQNASLGYRTARRGTRIKGQRTERTGNTL